MFLLKLRFKWAELQVHSYCSSKDMRGQSFALSQWKIAKISKPYGIQRVKRIKYSPDFILVGSIIVVPVLVTGDILKMFNLITKCYVF